MNKKIFALFAVLILAGSLQALTGPEVGGTASPIKISVQRGMTYNTEKNSDVTDDFYFRSPYDKTTKFKLEVEGAGASLVTLEQTEITLSPGTKPYHVPIIVNIPKNYVEPRVLFQITVMSVLEQTARQGVGANIELRVGKIYEITVSDVILKPSTTPIPTMPQSITNPVLAIQQTITPTPSLEEQQFASTNEKVSLTSTVPAKADLSGDKIIAALAVVAIALYLGSDYYFKRKKAITIHQAYNSNGLTQ